MKNPYESEHNPSCKDCHIVKTFPDANPQWEMGGRAAIDHISFCSLHAAAPELLKVAKELIDDDRSAIGKRLDKLIQAISKTEGTK